MNSYIATTVVGSAEGQFTNDIEKLIKKDGKLNVDGGRAIRQFGVRYGNNGPGDSIIFGLNVFYKLKDSDKLLEIRHGYQGAPTRLVSLEDPEVLVGVFGRAGNWGSYKHKVIASIGFTIFNTKTATVRTEGPFGVVSNNNTSGLEPFHVSNVMALGAYALEDEAPILTGLVFYKDILSA